MSELDTKKLLSAFGVFVVVMVGTFTLLVTGMYSLIEPTTIDELDSDYLALQIFFRNPPVELIQSYSLDVSLVDDVQKAFAVRVSGMDAELLWQQQGVVRGDRLTVEIEKAVEFIGGMLDSGYVDWFPSLEEMHRDSHYIYPVNIVMQGERPVSVKLIVMRPFDNMAFFAHLRY